MAQLPDLSDLSPTRAYLRDVALAMGSLQRGFLPPHPRLWQHGLEVTMRGFSTQPFRIDGGEFRAGLDLVKQKVRLGTESWPLSENNGPQIFEHFKLWLANQMAEADLEEPKFSPATKFDPVQAGAYGAALWWLEERLRELEASIKDGVTSPILLYPHHFDLALSWFPHDDERQLTLGFSTGDQNVPKPYIYLTAYPESPEFKSLPLPDGAHWQTQGFNGFVLPYAKLQVSSRPEELFKQLTRNFKTN
jgi:hypothetical protein